MENFIDSVKIKVISGNGGNGAISFRREKFIPFGGPDGGDGGDGGSIIFKCQSRRYDLLHLRFKNILRAGNGANGKGKKAHGKRGHDTYIELPPGCLISDIRGTAIHEFTKDAEEEFVLLPGAKGGKGNCHFKNSKNKTPRIAEKGQSGRELSVLIEMKLLADVGFVGLPNAGKSTLLRKMTRANAKVGHYPFTTLNPNLGMYQVDESSRLILADIPGIIADSIQGKGLGLDFLRHIERSSILFYIIDSSSHSCIHTFHVLEKELTAYYKKLGKDLEKPFFILFSKLDALESQDLYVNNREKLQEKKQSILKDFSGIPSSQQNMAFFSSHTSFGFEKIHEFLCQASQLKHKNSCNTSGNHENNAKKLIK